MDASTERMSNTTKESERLLRLPMYYGLTAEETAFVADQVKEFYGW